MLTVVDKGATPEPEQAKDNVVKAQFGRPSVSDQLRMIADRLDEGTWVSPEYLTVVFGYDNVQQNMVCLAGGSKDAHPYFIAGMLQNAMLTGLDEAAAQAWMAEEGMDVDE